MARNNKKSTNKLSSAINEKNLMMLLAIVLVLCVGYLVLQENKKSTKILEPTTVEQAPQQ